MSLSPTRTNGTRHCPSCTCRTTPQHSPDYDFTAALASFTSAETEMARLREDIRRNTEILLELTRRRNDLPPVARLPSELLSEIYLLCRDATTPYRATYYPRLSWISVLHVCADWRSVALSDPRLWNTPNLRFPSLVKHFINYSGTLPLHVVLSQLSDPDHPTVRHEEATSCAALDSSKNRITSLELYGSYRELRLCLYDLMPHVDSLESLEIYPDTDYTVSLDLLMHTFFPKLRTLRLRKVGITTRCHMLASCASLRELKLEHCTLHPNSISLTALSSLEKLSLINCLRCIPAGGTRIVLPALTQLIIEEEPAITLSLLEGIDLPPGCHVIMRIDSASPADSTALEQLVSYMCSTGPRQLAVILEPGATRLEFMGAGGIQQTLTMSGPDNVPWIIAVILSAGVEALSVSVDRGVFITEPRLHALCGGEAQRDRLTSLTIDGRGIFLEVLAPCLSNYTKFLSHLAVLKIEGANFTRLSNAGTKAWAQGISARRGVLKRIETVRCIGLAPASPASEDQDLVMA